MLRSVVDLESLPKRPSLGFAERRDQRLLTVSVELVHDYVDLFRLRVSVGDLLHRSRELRSLSVLCRVGPMTACLRRHNTEDVRCSTATVFVISACHLAWR